MTARTKRRRLTRRSTFQTLDKRELFAGDISATLFDGVLEIQGTERSDKIQVHQSQLGWLSVDGAVIESDDGLQPEVHIDEVNQIKIFGNAGDDEIWLSDQQFAPQADGKIELQAPPTFVDGGDDNDTITGGVGDDEIHGGRGHDVIYGGLGKNQLSGGEGEDEIYDQDRTRVVRPTLLIVTHGFFPERDFALDEWKEYAETIAHSLQAGGSHTETWLIDWEGKESNETPVRELVAKLNAFLQAQDEAWDVVFFGHSRGAILQHEVIGDLPNHENLGQIFEISMDPTASPVMHDEFPDHQREGVRTWQYDDGYMLLPVTVDSRPIEGVEAYHMVREIMQKDPPQAAKDWEAFDSQVSDIAKYFPSSETVIAKWVVKSMRAKADALTYHMAIQDWYFGSQFFSDDIANIIASKPTVEDHTTGGELEDVWLSAGGLEVTLTDLVVASIHTIRYGDQQAHTVSQNYVNGWVSSIEEAAVTIFPGDRGIKVSLDMLRWYVDQTFARNRSMNHQGWGEVEKFLTAVLPVIEAFEYGNGEKGDVKELSKQLLQLMEPEMVNASVFFLSGDTPLQAADLVSVVNRSVAKSIFNSLTANQQGQLISAVVERLQLDEASLTQATSRLYSLGLSHNRVVGILRADFGANFREIAKALRDNQVASLRTIAKALHEGGRASATDVADALRQGLKANYNSIADAIYNGKVDRRFDEIAKALKSEGANASNVADAIRKLGGDYRDVARAIYHGRVDRSLRNIAKVLDQKGASLKQIADAIHDGLGKTYRQVADAIYHSRVERSLRKIAKVLDQEGATLRQVADVIDDELGKNYRQVADALYHGRVERSLSRIAKVLDDEGATLREVADALDDQLGKSYSKIAYAIYHGRVERNLRKIAKVLDQEGATLREIADAIDDTLKKNYRQVADAIYHGGVEKNLRKIAKVLKQEGASFHQIADALDDQLKVGKSKVADALYRSGIGISKYNLAKVLRAEGASVKTTFSLLRSVAKMRYWDAYKLARKF